MRGITDVSFPVAGAAGIFTDDMKSGFPAGFVRLFPTKTLVPWFELVLWFELVPWLETAANVAPS